MEDIEVLNNVRNNFSNIFEIINIVDRTFPSLNFKNLPLIQSILRYDNQLKLLDLYISLEELKQICLDKAGEEI